MRLGYGVLVGLFLAAMTGLAGCASQNVDYAADKQSAKALFEEKCSFCHGLNVATIEGHTLEGWRDLVKKEASRKAWFISSAEQEVITQYLFKIYPADKEPPKPKPQGFERFEIPEDTAH